MNDNDKDKTKSGGDKFTPNTVFTLAVKLVAFGIVLFVLLTHLAELSSALKWVFSLISPFLLGGLIALILNTPQKSIEKQLMRLGEKLRRKPRRRTCELISLVLTFVLSALIVAVIACSVVPQLGESVKTIYLKMQENMPRFIEWLQNLEKYGINTDPIIEWFDEIDLDALIEKFTENIMEIIGALTSSVSSIISGASSIISGIVKGVTALVFAVYILSNKRKLGRQLKQLGYAFLKKDTCDKVIGVCSLTCKTFSNFFSGQCLEAIILGLLFFIAMTIFRFPYALPISMTIMLTAIIPYIGAFIGCVFGMLLIVIDDPIRALWFLVMFLIIQQLENNLIYPRVVGNSVGLPAIWTYTAVIVGGNLWGVFGMILFIPLFSVLYTLLRDAVIRLLSAKGVTVPHEDEEESPPKKHKFESIVSQMQSLARKAKEKDEEK